MASGCSSALRICKECPKEHGSWQTWCHCWSERAFKSKKRYQVSSCQYLNPVELSAFFSHRETNSNNMWSLELQTHATTLCVLHLTKTAKVKAGFLWQVSSSHQSSTESQVGSALWRGFLIHSFQPENVVQFIIPPSQASAPQHASSSQRCISFPLEDLTSCRPGCSRCVSFHPWTGVLMSWLVCICSAERHCFSFLVSELEI